MLTTDEFVDALLADTIEVNMTISIDAITELLRRGHLAKVNREPERVSGVWCHFMKAKSYIHVVTQLGPFKPHTIVPNELIRVTDVGYGQRLFMSEAEYIRE